MNSFDKNILLFFNSFINRSPHFDVAVLTFENNCLLKGAVFIALIWYLWCSQPEHLRLQTRQKLFGTLIAVISAIFIARLMANFLPFRQRPVANPELHLTIPDDLVGSYVGWSAFPSDHAALWFALAAGIFCVHRSFGLLALLYALLLGVGRIYLGIHNPTDIIAGAAIGVAIAAILNSARVRSALYAPMEKVMVFNPGLFYGAAFVLTYEIANMFNEVRSVAIAAWHMVHAI